MNCEKDKKLLIFENKFFFTYKLYTELKQIKKHETYKALVKRFGFHRFHNN